MSWRADGFAVLVLAAVILAAHGGALYDGWFFDDHWHRVTLRGAGWNWHDLVEAATFDVPGDLVQHWWQTDPLQWRYARPVAMAAMKLEDQLAGGRAFGVHAAGLAWHGLTTVLVYGLAAWTLRSRGWGLLAAALFAAHPHAVFAVSWTAARNALVSGCLFVAAVLCYLGSSRAGFAGRSGSSRATFAAALALWLLALFSRETAIVFAPLAIGLDAVIGGRGWVMRRWAAYLCLGLAGLAYLYWRLVVFPVAGPPGIYFTPPEGLSSLPFLASKLLQLTFALFIYTPMLLGLATYDGAPAEPLTHLVMLIVVALLAWWYVAASAHLRGPWLWPAWVLLAFLPVTPVFMMPHFAYLPAVAYAVMLAAMVRAVPRARWRIVVGVLVCLESAWSLAVYRYAWRGIVRSEQVVHAEITQLTPRPATPVKVFFINLPVAGIYSAVAMRTAWQQPNVTGYVLTYADHPLAALQAGDVFPIDPYTLEVRAESPGWFAGRVGEMLIDGMRGGEHLVAGELVPSDEFEVEVTEADLAGATGLQFRFVEPLWSPDYRFYWCTPEGVRRLSFDPSGVMQIESAAATPRIQAWKRASASYFAIQEFIGRFVRSGLYLTGGGPEPERAGREVQGGR